MARLYKTILLENVGNPIFNAFGRSWLVRGFIGRIQPQDIGKRVYLIGGTLQVENDEQRKKRVGAS